MMHKKLTERQKFVLANLHHAALTPTPFYHAPLWCIGRVVVADVLKALLKRELVKFDKVNGQWEACSEDLTRAALDDSLYAMI